MGPHGQTGISYLDPGVPLPSVCHLGAALVIPGPCVLVLLCSAPTLHVRAKWGQSYGNGKKVGTEQPWLEALGVRCPCEHLVDTRRCWEGTGSPREFTSGQRVPAPSTPVLTSLPAEDGLRKSISLWKCALPLTPGGADWSVMQKGKNPIPLHSFLANQPEANNLLCVTLACGTYQGKG